MDIKQLRYFKEIVEQGNISAAAEKLYMSQPPLSQQLRSLEQELDTLLFHRHGRKLELTEAGRSLYQYTLEILQLTEEAKQNVKDIGAGLTGTLSVGINTFSSTELLTSIQQFYELYPNVHLKIQQNESSHLCQLVKDRTIEMALIRLPLHLSEFEVLHVKDEPFYYVTSNQTPLNHTITWPHINEYPLMLPSSEGLGVYSLIRERLAKRGIESTLVGECSDIQLLTQMVAQNMTNAIVPEAFVKQNTHPSIKAVRIVDEEPFISPVGLIWLKNHNLSKPAERFLDELRGLI
ncbi:LysR family transcriptional regulator [Alkalicoccobacillus murimartini]|uniref:DNA-binding transcriptional LysR family regulator n=1 Tax=Alkalicoccobacillus murimartini TaxID=171685 RepID=A0ABT9YMV0_9BACI|nr:LysR family transcriptional regulator [Alkalicoccobacillus murimartini]MDQ0209081.1 DNA-binding transcriptional LysR family regulator [Alkalicoccobacillus murimartini]